MNRYVALAQPHPWINDAWTHTAGPTTIVVHEYEPAAKPTGLLNASGLPLYRVRDRVACGFCSPVGDQQK